MTEDASKSEPGSVPHSADSGMFWHESTSKNGKKYCIGVAKSDHPDLTDQQLKELFDKAASKPQPPHLDTLQSTTDGLLDVDSHTKAGPMAIPKIKHTTGNEPIYWPYAGSNDSWVKTVQRVKDWFDITRYSLSSINDVFYDYKLRVDITQAWNYRFYDDGGDDQDSYTLYCWTTGAHSIAYDSGHPTIVKIESWD